jgi:hypothetical protein
LHTHQVAHASGCTRIRLHTHQVAHSSGCTRIRINTHQDQHASGCTLIRLHTHQVAHASGCTRIRLHTHQVAHASGCTRIRLHTHQVAENKTQKKRPNLEASKNIFSLRLCEICKGFTLVFLSTSHSLQVFNSYLLEFLCLLYLLIYCY